MVQSKRQIRARERWRAHASGPKDIPSQDSDPDNDGSGPLDEEAWEAFLQRFKRQTGTSVQLGHTQLRHEWRKLLKNYPRKFNSLVRNGDPELWQSANPPQPFAPWAMANIDSTTLDRLLEAEFTVHWDLMIFHKSKKHKAKRACYHSGISLWQLYLYFGNFPIYGQSFDNFISILMHSLMVSHVPTKDQRYKDISVADRRVALDLIYPHILSTTVARRGPIDTTDIPLDRNAKPFFLPMDFTIWGESDLDDDDDDDEEQETDSNQSGQSPCPMPGGRGVRHDNPPSVGRDESTGLFEPDSPNMASSLQGEGLVDHGLDPEQRRRHESEESYKPDDQSSVLSDVPYDSFRFSSARKPPTTSSPTGLYTSGSEPNTNSVQAPTPSHKALGKRPAAAEEPVGTHDVHSQPWPLNKRHKVDRDPYLQASDIAGMQPGKCLNGTIIYFFLRQLASACPGRFTVIDPLHLSQGPTPVVQSLLHEQFVSNATNERTILLPVHFNNHWVLAVLRLANGSKTIEFYDSLYAGQSDLEYRPFTQVKTLLDQVVIDHAEDGPSWKMETCSCPEQANSIDCGISVCLVAMHLASGVALPQDTDWLLWRRIIILLCKSSLKGHRDSQLEVLLEVTRQYGLAAFRSEMGDSQPPGAQDARATSLADLLESIAALEALNKRQDTSAQRLDWASHTIRVAQALLDRVRKGRARAQLQLGRSNLESDARRLFEQVQAMGLRFGALTSMGMAAGDSGGVHLQASAEEDEEKRSEKKIVMAQLDGMKMVERGLKWILVDLEGWQEQINSVLEEL